MNYGGSRYLKLFAVLVVPATLAYLLLPSKATQSGGGTALGYALGILSCAIVVILIGYGYRKRCPPNYSDRRREAAPGMRADAAKEASESPGYKLRDRDRRKNQSPQNWRYGQTLQGWLSAHIYLGAALFVLVTLHAGFEFGWNVHTLAYVLTMVVIGSGFYGLYLYLEYPQRMTGNLGEDSLEDLIAQIEELNETARIRALELPDELNHLVYQSRIETCLGGNFWQQISGARNNCPTDYAIRQIRLFGQKYIKEEQPKFLRDLYSVMLRKQKLVFRAREAIKLKARMDAWLYLHVPFSMALLAAIGAHVLSILFFW